MTDQPSYPASEENMTHPLRGELVKYMHYMQSKVIPSQRVARRQGFIDGMLCARTREVESGVVRVRIEAETIDRCAENLYNVHYEDEGSWTPWQELDDEVKAIYVDQVKAVFAVLPMQP